MSWEIHVKRATEPINNLVDHVPLNPFEEFDDGVGINRVSDSTRLKIPSAADSVTPIVFANNH